MSVTMPMFPGICVSFHVPFEVDGLVGLAREFVCVLVGVDHASLVSPPNGKFIQWTVFNNTRVL